MFCIAQLKARLGEFWWASLLMFFACRIGDVINAFIGLWLVPRYVGLEELGAVLPLQNFAGILAVPISIFAITFTKHVNVLATAGEYGKMKTMLRSVFVAAGVFLLFAILISRLMMSLFLERVRVAEGALGVLIVAASFVGAVSPIYMNALQGLKRFKVLSVLNILSAPLRLVVMLIAMPFRALAGYFVGQAATPTFQMGASIWALRRELGGGVVAEPYWTRETVKLFVAYSLFVALYSLVPSFTGFYETLLIRQRLSNVDSAAYYMISRFAEIGTYAGATLASVVFPFASERSVRGLNTNRLIFWSMSVTLGFGVLFAGVLYLLKPVIFRFLPDGNTYVTYVPEMVTLTVILATSVAVNCGIVGDIAAGNFRFLWWWVPVHAIYGMVLILVTGYGYFAAALPSGLVDWIEAKLSKGLDFYLVLMGVMQLVKIACLILQKFCMRICEDKRVVTLSENVGSRASPRIGIHVHLFYEELWDEILTCVRNYIDLYGETNIRVFVTYPEDKPSLGKLIGHDAPYAIRIPVENRGYDIGPFIEVLHRMNLDDLDFVVKLHTKRDVKDGWVNFRHYTGGEWRKRLLSFCETKDAVEKTVSAFLKQPDLGMIADKKMIDPSGMASCHHAAFSDGAVVELGLKPKGRTIVWGTMFIARARLLKPFLKWHLEDFPPPSSLDPHRIEGLASRAEGAFGMVINAHGYRVSDGRAPAWKSVIWSVWMKCVYTVMRYTSDLLRGHKN